MYEIQSKSDFNIGSTLIVKIPEKELDRKALYTILSDKPDFILPFTYSLVDDQVEITYQIGNRSKFSYLYGDRSLNEYADLWTGILQPLLDCGDWFLNPYSFVLKSEYLYYDKSKKVFSFIYIPSIKAFSDYNTLKNMVAEIAKENHVKDVKLENKVVWAIQDFNPNEFLKVVKNNVVQGLKESVSSEILNPTQKMIDKHIPLDNKPIIKNENEKIPEDSKKPIIDDKFGDISINFPADGKAPKEKKTKGKLFGFKKASNIKPKEPKSKGNIFGKKEKMQKDIIQGAAAIPNQPEIINVQFNNSTYAQPIDEDVTMLDPIDNECVKLRYVGNEEHPKLIYVEMGESKVFTIGRFDASVGAKQSNFEFNKKTKAISRRHAAIERSADGYSIVDLSSSAGTYLNGQKLPPNAPFKLERGNRVSFGNAGADYIWEE